MLFLVALPGWSFANTIDGLQTRADVERFLVSRVSKKFKDEQIFGSRPGSDSTGMREWFYKTDVDGDGLTDLVVNGETVFVILDRGKKGYAHFRLIRDGDIEGRAVLYGIDSAVGRKRIVMKKGRGRSTVLDTLVWHAYGFMEYNDRPLERFDLEQITVSTTGCFGKCPVFELTVDGDRLARYKAIQFNDERGEFTGTISKEKFEHMLEVLRYLPLDHMDSSYAVDWTDDQTIFLEIHYNGQVKRISDYGLRGSFGLSRLYAYFFSWKEKTEWSEK